MMGEAAFYLCASSEQAGALSVFHAYGTEARLTAAFDRRLGGRRGLKDGAAALTPGELRYGWLWGGGGEEMIDEIMLGCPALGIRVVMTHGGGAVRAVVKKYFEAAGFFRLEGDLSGGKGWESDGVLDVLLSSCLTEAQAAAVLGWRVTGEAVPAGLLETHRVVLAGAANAGKSSLMNCLCGYDRAFVDERAGATRDVVDEVADVGGYALWLGDMPGYLEGGKGGGEVEHKALKRAEQRLFCAEWVWLVVDGSAEWEGETEAAAKRVAEVLRGKDGRGSGREGGLGMLVVVNKADLPQAVSGSPWREVFPDAGEVRVCSLPGGDAREVLGKAVVKHFGGGGHL